jgi:proteasome lid subunit RPN8/RPN11
MIESIISEQICRHAIADYPNESCGLVVKNIHQDHQEYVRLSNVSHDPQNSFRFNPSEYFAYIDKIVAIVHSHPDMLPYPSKTDMEEQIRSGLPWIIVSTNGRDCYPPFAFGDQVPREPLLLRGFRYGVTDCYGAIRDLFLEEAGILLKEFPRSWGFWNDDNPEYQPMYLDHFRDAGFYRLPEDTELQKFDVFLVSIRSGTPNHGGVYIGDGKVYHHLGSFSEGPFSPSKLPVIEYGHRWLAFNPIMVRHEQFRDR